MYKIQETKENIYKINNYYLNGDSSWRSSKFVLSVH